MITAPSIARNLQFVIYPENQHWFGVINSNRAWNIVNIIRWNRCSLSFICPLWMDDCPMKVPLLNQDDDVCARVERISTQSWWAHIIDSWGARRRSQTTNPGTKRRHVHPTEGLSPWKESLYLLCFWDLIWDSRRVQRATRIPLIKFCLISLQPRWIYKKQRDKNKLIYSRPS